MANERASKRQQELLSFVDGFIKEHGYGPSYREIMTALGYKSVSTVAIHIEGLIAKGYLARRDKSARSLEVITTQTASTPAGKSEVTEAQLVNELKKRIDTAELNDVEQDMVRRSFKLLGFTGFDGGKGTDEAED